MTGSGRREVLEHMWRRFPQHSIILTDPRTREAVLFAERRAAKYGFLKPVEVCSWMTLSVYFGGYFDEDALCPWAEATLQESAGANRDEVMARLFSRMNFETSTFAGPPYSKALLALLPVPFETLLAEDGDLHESLERSLRNWYPEKAAALSQDQWRYLLEASERKAAVYGLPLPAGAIFCMQCMTILGSEFDRDPLYPDAIAVMNSDTAEDPVEKLKNAFDCRQGLIRRHLILDRFRTK
ncbi:MAG TPA: hypothetical protein VGL53_18840 [Bryobacteraceae bacterium]|jgi:hypothetical protein